MIPFVRFAGRASARPLILTITLGLGTAQAGVIVVSHSPNYLVPVSVGVQVSNPTLFNQNLARFLDQDGQPGGRILVFNPTFIVGNQANIDDTPFSQAVTQVGYSVEAATSLTPFDLMTLAQYDAVLLAGFIASSNGNNKKDDAVLQAYVSAGGGVYIAGTNQGFGGASGFTNDTYWNSFLTPFDIAFEAALNNRVGILGGSGPLFADGATTGFINGFDLLVTGINPLTSLVQQAPGQTANEGLLAVYQAPDRQPVPEPATLALLGVGALAIGRFAVGRRTRGSSTASPDLRGQG